MNDVNNKSTIADKIHQAVSSLLDTEQRLTIELNEARALLKHHENEIELLRGQLARAEAESRSRGDIIQDVAKLVNP